MKCMANKKISDRPYRPLQAVIFDMDGLMFDTERVVQRSQNLVGERMGYGQLGCNIYHTLGMNVTRRRTYFLEKYGPSFPFEEFTENYRKECRRILREEGIPIKPGLLKLLNFLHEEGYPMAVATSSSRVHAEENLELAGVRDCFSVLLCGDQVTRSKPDPEIYEKTARALHAEPGKTLVLEDSQYGLLAALNAGMLPIMIPDLLLDLPDIEPRLEAKLPDLGQAADYIREHFIRETC